MNARTPLNSFHVRNFQEPEDVPGLVSLLKDAETVDDSGEDISEPTVRAQLGIQGHDPQKDRWVIDDPGDPHVLIGHSAIYTAAHDGASVIAEVNVIVHPQWRRRGLGSALFSATMDRARHLGVNYVRLYADRRHIQSAQFLTKKHFLAVAAYTEMRSTTINNANLLPQDFTILPYAAINDPSLLVAAYNTCYAEQWGHHRTSLERIEKLLQRIDVDGLFLMFASDHTLVGICRSGHSKQRTERNSQSTGYIDAPGVAPSFRAPHLYGALLLRAAHRLYETNPIIELESWGDAPEIIKLYQELGFVVLRQQDAYQRELKDG